MTSTAVDSLSLPVPSAPAEHPRRHRLTVADRDLSVRSEAELIAQVLGGSEPAAEVLRCGARLARLPFWQRRALGVSGLVRDHGLPPDRAVRLAALWELAERWYPDDRPVLGSPRDVLLLLDDLRRQRTEHVVVVLLDARHRLIRVETVAQGTVNASRFQPRDVLGPAVAAGAAAIVMAHNHPSGDPMPSRADRAVTTAMRDAAAVLGMPLLDHVIVAQRGHHSFREADGWPVDGGGPA